MFFGPYELPARINNFIRLFVLFKSILDFRIRGMTTFCSMCYKYPQPSDPPSIRLPPFATEKCFILVQLKTPGFFFRTH